MALQIKADGTRTEIEPENENGTLSPNQIKTAIGGGWLEIVSCDPKVTGGYVAFYCDEEGKLKQFPPNEEATRLSTYTAPSDIVCGDVIFCKKEELD